MGEFSLPLTPIEMRSPGFLLVALLPKMVGRLFNIPLLSRPRQEFLSYARPVEDRF